MPVYKVEICGVNTSKLPLLSAEEKEELFKRILEGDSEAREQYIKGNLRLVLSVIQRFSSSQENIDDLFQIGCIGLIKAIDNFDITQNVKFSTYAVPMILGEVRRYLRDNNSIRVSRSLRDTAYKALYAREQLTRRNAKEPTLMEISQEIGVPGEDITYALDAIQTPMSLYEPVYTDGGDPLYVMDQISDKKNLEENWVEDLSLVEAMQRLPERERHIIDMRFFDGKTQTEVAEEIHISYVGLNALHLDVANMDPELVKNMNEVVLRIALRTQEKEEAQKLIPEIAPLQLNGPPGASFFGGRAKVSEVIGLWPTLIPRDAVRLTANMVEVE